MARNDREDVVYVEREGGSGFGWFLLGMGLGAGLALLFAPKAGPETRGDLTRGLGRLKTGARSRLDDLGERLADKAADLREQFFEDDDEDDDIPEAPAAREATRPASGSAREELERRLAAARARRRSGKAVVDEGDKS
jgi:Sec-independent protein translocase protein TatA